MSTPAWGFGLATSTPDGKILDVWYPEPALGTPPDDAAPSELLLSLERDDDLRRVHLRIVQTVIDLDDDPRDAADIFLRLHLLSWRLATPNSFSLEGIYDVLETVVWTDSGPCCVDDFAETRLRVRAATNRPVRILSEDKFPRMVDYVIPRGVRISEGDRMRLGAYIAEGTVVTHAAFVDFNAGSLGASIIEGRINKGVTVGEGSHVGGGASTMGDLSTDSATRVAIGKNCYVGNNAGLGIAIGDNCYVEEGLYITRDNRITVLPTGGISPGPNGYIEDPGIIPAHYLAGLSNVRYRRNSQTGAIEASPQEGTTSAVLAEVLELIRGRRLR